MADRIETLEGRLMAQRKLLARLVATLEARGEAAEVLEFLEERSQFQGFEEDPGAVPSEELSIEFAMSDEMRQVLDAVRRYRAACEG